MTEVYIVGLRPFNHCCRGVIVPNVVTVNRVFIKFVHPFTHEGNYLLKQTSPTIHKSDIRNLRKDAVEQTTSVVRDGRTSWDATPSLRHFWVPSHHAHSTPLQQGSSGPCVVASPHLDCCSHVHRHAHTSKVSLLGCRGHATMGLCQTHEAV